MKNKCQRFRELGGVLQPICSCGSCWSDYFDLNSGKYHAARLALEETNEATVRAAEVIMLTKGMTKNNEVQILDLPRKQWIEAQADRFIKALKFRVRLDQKREAA